MLASYSSGTYGRRVRNDKGEHLIGGCNNKKIQFQDVAVAEGLVMLEAVHLAGRYNSGD